MAKSKKAAVAAVVEAEAAGEKIKKGKGKAQPVTTEVTLPVADKDVVANLSESVQVERCIQRLREMLASGPAKALATASQLKREGFPKTAVDAARRVANVRSFKGPDGPMDHRWELSTASALVEIEGP